MKNKAFFTCVGFVFVSLLFLFSCRHSSQEGIVAISEEGLACDSLGYYIPFEIIDGGIIVKTKINDTIEASLLIDNGCSDLYLSKQFVETYAEVLNLKHYPDIEAIGYFIGEPNLKNTIAEGRLTFHFGDSVFENKNTSAYQHNGKMIDHFSGVYGRDIFFRKMDGILPLHIFSKRGIVSINFQKKRIEFTKQIDTSFQRYPYTEQSKLPIIETPVKFGEISLNLSMLPDLGSPGGSVDLYRTKKVQKKLSEIKAKTSKNVEFSPQIKDFSYYFDSVDLDGLILKDILFSVYPPFVGGGNVDLLIGMDILSQYDIAFDYNEKYIYMKPLNSVFSLKSDTSSILSGVLLTVKIGRECTEKICNNELKYRVSGINHRYNKADFKFDDIVLKIGKYNITNIKFDSLKQLRKQKDTRTNATVIRGKDTISLDEK